MTTADQSPPVTAGSAVELTLSAEQARVQTVRTAVEVVTVARRVVTETVQVPVQLRREELVVTRTPVRQTSQAVPSGSAADELGSLIPEPRGDLVIVLRREVPVVTLDIEATERVTVRVTTVTDQQTVTTELRREHAEVTATGDTPSHDAATDPT